MNYTKNMILIKFLIYLFKNIDLIGDKIYNKCKNDEELKKEKNKCKNWLEYVLTNDGKI